MKRIKVIKNVALSHVVPYIERELTKSERGAVDWTIDRFADNIMDEVMFKKIGQHLSSGMDTRAILAVLLHNHIMPVCYTHERDNDIEVASKICKRFGLKHVIIKVKDNHTCFYPSFDQYETDIVFSGLMMSEYINFYNAPFEAGDVRTTFYKHIPAIYNLNGKIRLPIIDTELLNVLNNIPPFFRRHKKIQKLIIERFYPKLLLRI
jgi:hypothetical protein